MKYKLTKKDGKTHGGMKWGVGVTHTIRRKGNVLCSGEVIHNYDDPYLAILMNPIQGNFNEATMLLWEGDDHGTQVATDGTKNGCKRFTTLSQIPLPDFPLEKRVEVAIHLALQLYPDKAFRKWAMDWLDGKDRTAESAAWYASFAAWYASSAGLGEGILLETIYAVMEGL